jgi:AcrR family transcriptional regulator
MAKHHTGANRKTTALQGSWRPSADKILSASADLFDRRGYGETSLRELMSAARVSTTAFYARFASKEDVLEALVKRLLVDLEEAATTTIAAGGDFERGFERGVAAMTEVILRHRVAVRLALTEAPSSAKTKTMIARAYTGLAKLLGSRLGGEAAGWALVGALAMQVQRWAVFDDLDDRGLEKELVATARALLPARRRRRS